MWCSRAAALHACNPAPQTTTSDLADARPPSPQGEGKKAPLSLAIRDKGAITSAVPLLFCLAAALDLAVSGKPGAAYLARVLPITDLWLAAALSPRLFVIKTLKYISSIPAVLITQFAAKFLAVSSKISYGKHPFSVRGSGVIWILLYHCLSPNGSSLRVGRRRHVSPSKRYIFYS